MRSFLEGNFLGSCRDYADGAGGVCRYFLGLEFRVAQGS